MSEEIDLVSKNISISEDAFEQFQAGAMYEEDEFITLADIASPTQSKSDVTDVLTDMPSDEIISTQDQIQDVNNVMLHKVETVENIAETSDNVPSDQVTQKNIEVPIKVPKKRGRKKKTENTAISQNLLENNPSVNEDVIATNNSDLNYDMIIGEDDIPEEFLSRPNISSDKPKRSKKTNVLVLNKDCVTPKRGRPRKGSLNVTRESKESTEDGEQNTIKDVPKVETNGKVHKGRGRRRRKNNIEENTKQESNFLTDNINSMAQNDSTDISLNKSSIDDDIVKETTTEIDSKILNKEIPIDSVGLNQLSEDDLEDLPLMAISKRNQLAKQESSKVDRSTKMNIASHKKRGRPKKDKNVSTLSDINISEEVVEAKKLDENNVDDPSVQKLNDNINQLENAEEVNKISNQDNKTNSANTTDENIDSLKEGLSKRNVKIPLMEDFEYNIDSVINNNKDHDSNGVTTSAPNELLEPINEETLLEESTKRPVRRKAKKAMHYDEGSDEDPFANVELSDDEPKRGRKSGKYYSDDEYIPGGKRGKPSTPSESTDSEIDMDLIPEKKPKKKKGSPRKSGIKSDSSNVPDIVTTIQPTENVDDIEGCLETSVIKNEKVGDKLTTDSVGPPEQFSSWGKTNAFENFLAKKIQSTEIKIKKAKSVNAIVPLQIPVLDPNERKAVDIFTQTTVVTTKSSAVQTNPIKELPMKDQIALTAEQSVKACEFLSNIVKTTAELGQLMTQKSEDFIEKKINTNYVVDTFKMDYCVKKSFLLFKLAKHNLEQMENDLTKQYDEFLKANNLLQYREKEKVMSSTVTGQNSDSDCEIIEDTSTTTKAKKPVFNPKTVFLNKELSIKIAKKPSTEPKPKEKIAVKGRHAVWINDSIMVKKVKPDQSFLAQDSRNKKPPDTFVTLKMVNDFFSMHNYEKAISLCASLTTPQWYYSQHNIVCNYFIDTTKTVETMPQNSQNNSTEMEPSGSVRIESKNECSITTKYFVKSLLDLSIQVLQNHMFSKKKPENDRKQVDTTYDATSMVQNLTNNSQKCINQFNCLLHNKETITKCDQNENISFPSLKLLTYNRMVEVLYKCNCNNKKEKFSVYNDNIESCINFSNESMDDIDFRSSDFLQTVKIYYLSDYENSDYNDLNDTTSFENVNNIYQVPFLKTLSYSKIVQLAYKPCENEEQRYRNFKFDRGVSNSSLNNITMTPTVNSSSCVLSTSVIEKESDHYVSEVPTLKALSFYIVRKLACVSNKDENYMIPKKTIGRDQKTIDTLFSLCVQFIQNYHTNNDNICTDKRRYLSMDPAILDKTMVALKDKDERSCSNGDILNNSKIFSDTEMYEYCNDLQTSKNRINNFTLKLCKEKEIESLKTLTLKKVMTLIYEHTGLISHFHDTLNGHDKNLKHNVGNEQDLKLSLVINEVNTVTHDFFNEEDNLNEYEDIHDYEDDNAQDYEDGQIFGDSVFEGEEQDFDNDDEYENTRLEDNNWSSKVEMKVLRSDLEPNTNKYREIPPKEVEDGGRSLVIDIKVEPQEVAPDNIVDSSVVKAEPLEAVENDDFIPADVVTKMEHCDPVANNAQSIARQNSNSFDEDTFESFVRANKIMASLSNYEAYDEEIFSQSSYRVRRQYEPDTEQDLESFTDGMGLLVPQNTDTAKDRLMQFSSDEESNNKKNDKKKPTKRKGKLKNKKDFEKDKINKEEHFVPTIEKPNNISDVANLTKKDKTNKEEHLITTKVKPIVNSEVAILTRRMREKIRLEEKKENNLLSDVEDIPLNKRKESLKDKSAKSKTVTFEPAVSESVKDKSAKTKSLNIEPLECKSPKDKSPKSKANIIEPEEEQTLKDKTESTENAIQCSDVDSTETITELNKRKNGKRYKPGPKSKKKINKVDGVENCDDSNSCPTNDTDDRAFSPIISSDKPVELLECEPTLPFLEDMAQESARQEECNSENEKTDNSFTVRNGWHCYSIKHEDQKIYQYPHIALEKLPESFVETYFRYQEVTDRSKDDSEIDRLTNLQSLHRTHSKERANFSKPRPKSKKIENFVKDGEGNLIDAPEITVKTEPADELSPSEDEADKVDEKLEPAPVPSSENTLAKNSLMNENDSDTEKPNTEDANGLNVTITIKNETTDESPKIKRKIGPKSKCKVESKEVSSDGTVMLTAEKVMNKELELLHAPVVLKDESPEIKDVKKPITRKSHRKTSKSSANTEQVKEISIRNDDSSSEEEKQWVTTKEKLLKRLEKKQENPSVDDAKRAKIVSEYIEKRNEPVRDMIRPTRPRRPRSKKKLLERRKQMKILSRELFGDSSTHTPKYSTYGKTQGRRNIRKVIDKKALARSTVLSNMYEFERKRRLNFRATKLKEILGCEEDVNVIVINDELCLEYDFTENQPLITVHQFFTKVMKAHQYEGVKFMWDACFESAEMVEAGQAGGGCILAHCMGLGKTLQVLALLHTVLTHSRVRMKRVLVCCPLSTVLNWVDEIHKWIGPVTDQIKVFELSKLKKTYERAYQLEDWYNGGGIFIIGYELFRSLTTLDPMLDDVRPTIVNKIRSALLDPGPDIVICDEGHLLKNDSSVLAVAMSRVATKRRIVLTGTPMQNNLREYYCMVNFVKPNLLGTYSEYSNRFENPIMNGQHRDSREEDIKLMKARTHILHKVLEGCLQRQEASVLYPYLPKKHEYSVFITLTKCQWDLYKHYMVNYAKGTKQSVLKDFHVLQKIWSHPQVLHYFQTRAREVERENAIKAEKCEDDLARADLAASEDIKPAHTEVWWLEHLDGGKQLHALHSSNKFLFVFRLLDQCVELGDKVLIFSTSLYTLDALEYFLRQINKWSLGQEYYRLDGSVPAEVRQKWCREFNAENNHKTKLFLISTRAGSLGLNMTAANRVIILDTSWNPAHDIQSIFRVYRFGQKKDCYIYRLIALGTMEQKIYERSVTKQAVACRVVDEQQIDRHYNMSELNELYSWDEAGANVGAGLAAGVRDAVLLRVASSLGDCVLHAVREHDSLLRDSNESSLPESERAAAWQQFQMEQAHTQMQAFQVNVPKKPVHRQNIPLKNVKCETENTETITDEIKQKSVNRRKSRNNVPIDTNQPSTSQHVNFVLDPNKEQNIIDKIRGILIQHNVGPKGPQDIANLIANVREFVRSGVSNADPLVKSIANVLIQEENSLMCHPASDVYPVQLQSSMEEPEFIVSDLNNTNIVIKQEEPVSADQELEEDSAIGDKKRRRNRRDSDDEYVPPNTYVPRKKKIDRSIKSPAASQSPNKKEQEKFLSRRISDAKDKSTTDETDKTETILGLADTGNIINTSFEPEPKNIGKKTLEKKRKSVTTENLLKPMKEKQVDLINDSSYYTSSSFNIDLLKSNITKRLLSQRETNTDTVISNSPYRTRSSPIVEPEESPMKRKRGRPRKVTEGEKVEGTSKVPIIEKSKPIESETMNVKISRSTRSKQAEVIKSKLRPVNIDKFKSKQSEPTDTENLKSKLIKPINIEKLKSKRIPTSDIEIQPQSEPPKIDSLPKSTNDVPKPKSKQSKAEQSSKPQIAETEKPKDTSFPVVAPVVDDVSILLSDDDDVPTPAPGPNSTPIQNVAPNTSSDITTTEEDNEYVPLHSSLLSNHNFIKLVAHTYLYNNPMLDEDAAVLAAQYSTLKALREIESTGKDICSGPIYDIAIKVLGKDLLKKLHKASIGVKDNSETFLNPDTNLDELTSDLNNRNGISVETPASNIHRKDEDIPGPSTSKPKRKSKKNIEEIRVFSAPTSHSIDSSTPVPTRLLSNPLPQTVVPVGMFSGLSSGGVTDFISGAQEESILPDDDILIIPCENNSTSNQPFQHSTFNTVPVVATNTNEIIPPEKPAANSRVQTALPPNLNKVVTANDLMSESIKHLDKTVAKSQPNTMVLPNQIPTSQAVQTNQKLVVTSSRQSGVPTLTLTPKNDQNNSQESRPTISSTPLKQPLKKLPETNNKNSRISTTEKTKQKITSTSVTATNKHNLSVSNDETICLDSDEDETPSSTDVKINASSLKSVDNNLPTSSKTNNKQLKKIVILSDQSLQSDKSLPRGSPTDGDKTSSAISESIVKTFETRKPAPGDIIRISETGKIEILKRTEPSANAAAVKSKLVNKGDLKTIELKKVIVKGSNLSKDTIASNSNKNDVQKPQEIKQQSSGVTQKQYTSESFSYPQSDVDPLSILNDVVHIQANNDDEQNSNEQELDTNIRRSDNSISNTSKPCLQNTNPLKEPHTVAISNVKITKLLPSQKLPPPLKSGLGAPKSNLTTTPQQKPTNVHNPTVTQKPAATVKPVSTQKLVTAQKAASTSKANLPTAKAPLQQKSAAIISTDTIDLTEGVDTPTAVVKKKIVDNVIKRFKSFATTISTTKDKPAISKVNATMPALASTSKSVNCVKSVAPSTSQTSNAIAKRPSPWLAKQQIKKTKLDNSKSMTLKDFSFDDLDDIIELE